MVILVKDMIVGLYLRDQKVAVYLLVLSILIYFVFQVHVVLILIFNLLAVFALEYWNKWVIS